MNVKSVFKSLSNQLSESLLIFHAHTQFFNQDPFQNGQNSIFSILLEPNLKKAKAQSIWFQNEHLMVHFEDTK